MLVWDPGLEMHAPAGTLVLDGWRAYLYSVACHPVHFVFSQQLSILGAVTSHSGYEGLVIKGRRILRLGDFSTSFITAL